jgi:choline dehydrogenase-like flavoprotein
MLVMQLFFPASCQEPSLLSLQNNGRLRIEGHPNTINTKKLGGLFRSLRRIGAWSHRALFVRVPIGHAVHYAGTLPMKRDPAEYQCTPFGKLHGTRHLYVADSASFTDLPAKNMSFAMMAHAMRVAHHVSREMRDAN